MIPIERIRNDFSNIRRGWGGSLSESALEERVQALNLVVNKEKGWVMDVGCGGSEVEYYLEMNGFNVVAVDCDPKCLMYFDQVHRRKNFVCCDIYRHHFDPKSFKYILIISTIEHFSNDRKLVEILRPLLEKDGKLIITAPYTNFEIAKATGQRCKVYDPESIKELTSGWVVSFQGFKNFFVLELR